MNENKNKQVKSINCTRCAGPLTLYGGGHKIRALNCEHCGAIIDVHQDYRIFATFKQHYRPDCPLEIGQQGKIKGVEFIIIGMVGWCAEGKCWTDLMLYSVTHGYTWLSYDQGHYVFFRRSRALPSKDIWQLKAKQTLCFNRITYQFYERYTAEIVYVSGELTWIAQVGDKTQQAEAIAPPLIISTDLSEQESEYYLGEYISNQQIHQAFHADPPPKAVGIHAAQPFHAPLSKAIYQSARWVVVITLLALFLITFVLDGTNVLQKKLTPTELASDGAFYEFEITQPERLVYLNAAVNLRNAWAIYDIIISQQGNPLFTFAKEAAYYEGYEDGESWSEGDNTFSATFKLPAAGKYGIHITQSESGDETRRRNPVNTVMQLSITEGYFSGFYLTILLIFSIAATLWYFLRRRSFEIRRWNGIYDD